MRGRRLFFRLPPHPFVTRLQPPTGRKERNPRRNDIYVPREMIYDFRRERRVGPLLTAINFGFSSKCKSGTIHQGGPGPSVFAVTFPRAEFMDPFSGRNIYEEYWPIRHMTLFP